MSQTLKSVLLFVVAVLFAVLSFEALSKLWAGYRDSPRWIYIAYGVASGLAAVACSVLGIRSYRQR
jgi:hypothetical protein